MQESRNVPMSLGRHYGRTKGTRRDRIKQIPVRRGDRGGASWRRFNPRYDLTELEAALDQGCRALGHAQGVTMTFAFHALDERLAGPLTSDDDALLAALDNCISWRVGRRE
jgi:hypothetical protein